MLMMLRGYAQLNVKIQMLDSIKPNLISWAFFLRGAKRAIVSSRLARIF
jgi:hypothetical protein